MEFDTKKKIGRWNINGTDYYVYTIPQIGGKRKKRIYASTLEELKQKVEAYEIPLPDTNSTFEYCFKYFLDYGKLSKQESESYLSIVKKIPDYYKKLNICGFTSDIFDKIVEEAGLNRNEIVLFLSRFSQFCENEGLMDFTWTDTENYILSEKDYLSIKNTAYDNIKRLDPDDDLWTYQRECCLYFICVLGLSQKEVLEITANDVIKENNRTYIKIKNRKNITAIPNIAVPFLDILVNKVPTGALFGKCTKANMSVIYRQYSNLLYISGINGQAIRTAYIIFLLQHNVTIAKVASILSVSRDYLLYEFGKYCDFLPNENESIADFVGNSI